MASSETEDEDEFFDAFDPSLPTSLKLDTTLGLPLDTGDHGEQQRQDLSIEIPQSRSSPGVIVPMEQHISESIESKIPFAGNGLADISSSSNRDKGPSADLDDLTLDLTPYFNETDSDVKTRTRSISRHSSFHPTVETIEEGDAADTESENPVPSESLDHLSCISSDKDSSVPSVADTNSESSGSKSLLSRFRRAVGAVNFTTSPLKSLPPPESDPSSLKLPKSTPTAAGYFVNPFLFSGKAATVFDRLKETQTLGFHQQAVWVTAFSLDGKFLATGGKDGRVVVWSVGIDRRGVSDQDINRDGRSDSVTTVDEEILLAYQSNPFPLLFPIPCRVYRDHTDDITDLAWTRRHFLLSASADKTARLWNVKRFVSSSSLLVPAHHRPQGGVSAEDRAPRCRHLGPVPSDPREILRQRVLRWPRESVGSHQGGEAGDRFSRGPCLPSLPPSSPPLIYSPSSLFLHSTLISSPLCVSVPTVSMSPPASWTAMSSCTRRLTSSTTRRSPASARTKSSAPKTSAR
jgi:WD40 repeat protein